jgi:hypothetical protein
LKVLALCLQQNYLLHINAYLARTSPNDDVSTAESKGMPLTIWTGIREVPVTDDRLTDQLTYELRKLTSVSA